MPTKIATAEDVQAELRTLLAMTEEETPSRAKLAAALSDLASRVAGGPSLYSVLNVAFEGWGDEIGQELLKGSHGINYLGCRIDGHEAIIKLEGARGNWQDIHLYYELNSGVLKVDILGQIEGKKIRNCKTQTTVSETAKQVAEQITSLLSTYMERNEL